MMLRMNRFLFTERKRKMSQGQAKPTVYFANVREQAVFGADGPQPQFLLDSARGSVVLAGLEAGQRIPPHPESMAVYQFLEGEGTMQVEEETYAVTAGATVIVPQGASRGIQAETRMIFLGVKFA
jgi:quercetin dioxygenase-like cupin family protein